MNIETANRLYELRKEKGFSQEELAEKLNISRQAVSKWERAEASPDTDNLINLARLYGMTLDDLLNASGADPELLKAPQTENAAQEPAAPDSRGFTVDIPLSHGRAAVDIPVGPVDFSTFLSRLPYGLIGVIAFLAFGCFTGRWSAASLLLLLIPVIMGVADAWKGRFDYPGAFWRKLPISVMATCVFLFLGFACGTWHPSWLVFLLIPLYYGVVKAAYPPTPDGDGGDGDDN